MNNKEVRQQAKNMKFHDIKCPYPKTATCLCGREPFYSPAQRKERGEIE